MAIARTRPRISLPPRDVAWCDDLSRSRELLVFGVDTIVDNGDGGAFALTRLPGSLDAGMSVDRVARDSRPLQVPLLGKRTTPAELLHELRMAKEHVVASQQ